MSVLRYAASIRCDWPGCERTDTVGPPDYVDAMNLPEPEGWVFLGPGGLLVQTSIGVRLGEICPEHAGHTVREFVEILRLRERERGTVK